MTVGLTITDTLTRSVPFLDRDETLYCFYLGVCGRIPAFAVCPVETFRVSKVEGSVSFEFDGKIGPISGARVELLNESERVLTSVVSNETGNSH